MTDHTFDKSMEAVLLANGFDRYDGWPEGPIATWNGHALYSMQLYEHDKGYFIILRQNTGGDIRTVNMGSSNNAKDIITLRDALMRLW